MTVRNRLISAVGEDDARALSLHMGEVSLEERQTLVREGSTVSTLFFPNSAVVSECVVLDGGKMLETASVGFEGVVGLMATLTDTPQYLRSFVQIGGTAIAVDAAALKARALESPHLLSLLMKGLLLHQVQAHQGAACLAHHTLPRRLAKWLLATVDRTDSLCFPLTQEYLATTLGAQRTSVSAAAAKLKRQEVLEYARGSITVLDRSALENQACECYRTAQKIESEISGASMHQDPG